MYKGCCTEHPTCLLSHSVFSIPNNINIIIYLEKDFLTTSHSFQFNHERLSLSFMKENALK